MKRIKKKYLPDHVGYKRQFFSNRLITLSGLLILIFILGFDESTFGFSGTDLPEKLIVEPNKAATHNLSDIIYDVEYIQLQLPQDEYISEIKKAIFNKSSIFILDIIPGGGSYKIFCFDQYGKFNFVIDNQGRGPKEYERIYDFDVVNKFIVISTYKKLMYYDLNNGEYIKSLDKPDFCSIQMVGMLETNVVLSDEGRYKSNKSKRQIKIIDLEKRKIVFEALPFADHSLKIAHTFRYMYRYKDAYSVVPMYVPTVYRVIKEGNNYSVNPVYQFEFGKYWIDGEILANSYDDRLSFFNSQQEYVHTIEVFETEHLIYVNYRLQLNDYIYIYDKKSGKSLNVSGFTDNNIGWTGMPIGTMGNKIVNTIAPWEIKDSNILPNEELKTILERTEDEGHPILVMTQFSIK